MCGHLSSLTRLLPACKRAGPAHNSSPCCHVRWLRASELDLFQDTGSTTCHRNLASIAAVARPAALATCSGGRCGDSASDLPPTPRLDLD